MIRLSQQYKPLNTQTTPINLRKDKGITLKDNSNSFKNQFLKVQSNLERSQQGRLDEIKKQAKALEGQLVKMMVDQMKKTVNKSGFIDGGQGEKIFSGMLNEEYSKEISKNGNLGLADTIYKQLTGSLYR